MWRWGSALPVDAAHLFLWMFLFHRLCPSLALSNRWHRDVCMDVCVCVCVWVCVCVCVCMCVCVCERERAQSAKSLSGPDLDALYLAFSARTAKLRFYVCASLH